LMLRGVVVYESRAFINFSLFKSLRGVFRWKLVERDLKLGL
jgi:hypothetical protein